MRALCLRCSKFDRGSRPGTMGERARQLDFPLSGGWPGGSAGGRGPCAGFRPGLWPVEGCRGDGEAAAWRTGGAVLAPGGAEGSLLCGTGWPRAAACGRHPHPPCHRPASPELAARAGRARFWPSQRPRRPRVGPPRFRPRGAATRPEPTPLPAMGAPRELAASGGGVGSGGPLAPPGVAAGLAGLEGPLNRTRRRPAGGGAPPGPGRSAGPARRAARSRAALGDEDVSTRALPLTGPLALMAWQPPLLPGE